MILNGAYFGGDGAWSPRMITCFGKVIFLICGINHFFPQNSWNSPDPFICSVLYFFNNQFIFLFTFNLNFYNKLLFAGLFASKQSDYRCLITEFQHVSFRSTCRLFQIAYEGDFRSLCICTVTFWQKVDFLISTLQFSV